MRTHNLFLSRNKKYLNFLSDNFHFLVVNFSVYLNRHVFVMPFQKGSGVQESKQEITKVAVLVKNSENPPLT